MASPNHIWAGLSTVHELAKLSDIPDASAFTTKDEFQAALEEIKEKVVLVDGDGSILYESSPSYTDTEKYYATLYTSGLSPVYTTIHQYSIAFNRPVSSVKIVATFTGTSFDNPNYVRAKLMVESDNGKTGSETVTVSNHDRIGTLNANLNFEQMLSSVTIKTNGAATSSNSSQGGSASVNVSNFSIYLPEQLFS